MAAAASPSSSPRLPSPPPIAEDQIGPTSPGVSLFEDQDKLLSQSLDAGASRRIRPGTKSEDMTEGPPLVELSEIDTAFQLTEHLKALYYHHTHPADSNATVPITANLARQLCRPPEGTSTEIWLYELGRFLIQKTNAIIVHLFADIPPCSPQTCSEMRASEWQYLCAVHDPPKSCSAIDYCCHTLDWAATSLTSSKMFPSRLNLGTAGMGGGHDKTMQAQLKEITNIFRRVYRIFAHAWFQHRDMFWRVEGKTGLYIFYKTVCDEYNLIQPENYTIPPEAEGQEPDVSRSENEKPQVPSILSRPPEDITLPDPANTTIAHGNTTKRHTHSRDPSSSVATVIQEEAEPEDEDPPQPKRGLDRSSTILHTKAADPEPLAEPIKTDDEEPTPGIERTDTLKPTTPEPQQASEEADAGEETVILAEPEVEAKSEPQSDVHVKVEPVDPIEPEESPAADPEEAGKTVAD
ncbi:MOB kinase activator-like 4 [Pseudocercospora fuligena]|uniref:MOB kinase activator-like 4 n=1 Tax=Pseudocercospora fuligena TaxID=685502 RepID=A0A8H6VN27_9PEZI|nr:MOB kinase activator-like 4 [Pseudocercospora fuligena]